MDNRRSGLLAEDAAAAFLCLKGLKILERRYRYRTKEIDIIAWDGRTVIFVEVKFRRSARRGAPAEAVDARKQRQILFAARGYLRERSLDALGCRFDVVEVRLREGGLALHLDHILGAFRGG